MKPDYYRLFCKVQPNTRMYVKQGRLEYGHFEEMKDSDFNFMPQCLYEASIGIRTKGAYFDLKIVKENNQDKFRFHFMYSEFGNFLVNWSIAGRRVLVEKTGFIL